eukprot:TRINITY_DN1401_c0_g1_i1.p1 TRINITY_DN1401_c0_g1~~TRINITY_DN1401_c0_g1_i1.p1  ORF type:complete len:327 (-),score=52.65 TRINITY_DN1401_c0_g1_i1:302-1282(-)
MAMRAWVSLMLLSAFLFAQQGSAVRTRETQHDSLFINIPLIPAHLSRYLNSSVIPRLYNDSAWVSINAYTIDKLETPIGELYDTVNGLSGFMVKTVAHVTQLDGSNPGQMVVDMDFGTTLQQQGSRKLSQSGWEYRQGCASTHGVRVESPTATWARPQACPAWSYMMTNTSSLNKTNLDVHTSDGRTLVGSYGDVSGTVPDSTLMEFAYETSWKYEQTADRYYTQSNQTGRKHSNVTSIEFSSVTSTLAYGRHGWSGEAFGSLCVPVGRCFRAGFVQYVDADPTYVTLVNGSNQYTVRGHSLPTTTPTTVGPTKAPTTLAPNGVKP